MNRYKDTTDIELTQSMKKLDRQISELRGSGIAPRNATASQVVDAAKARETIDELVNKQLELSRELLNRDNEREKAKTERLAGLVADGKKEAEALLRELPVLAENLDVAFTYLGAEWQRLQAISQSIRYKNQILLKEGKPQLAPLTLEPSHLQRILKRSLHNSFGSRTIDAHLPTPVPKVSLTDELTKIIGLFRK